MVVTVQDGRVVDVSACRVADCERPGTHRGLCQMHYLRASRPRRPGHAEAAAAILPTSHGVRRSATAGPAEVTADDRATVEALDLICEMVAGIPPADIERLMGLTYLLGGKDAFEAAAGMKLGDLHAVWRFHMDLSGQAEPPEEEDDE